MELLNIYRGESLLLLCVNSSRWWVETKCFGDYLLHGDAVFFCIPSRVGFLEELLEELFVLGSCGLEASEADFDEAVKNDSEQAHECW